MLTCIIPWIVTFKIICKTSKIFVKTENVKENIQHAIGVIFY